MRIDKYIWSVRIFKTRSLASKGCHEEKVLVDKVAIKASKSVKINDVISVKHLPIWRTYKIIDFPKTRVGAKLVNNFIIEITNHKDLEILHQHDMVLRQNKNLGIKGRPTKKDRRNLKKIIG